MGDSLREKFLGDSHESDARSGKYDSVRESLYRISHAWQSKPKTVAKYHTRVVRTDERAQWRKDLASALESTATHVFIVSLLLVDLLATAVDILKTIHNKTHDLNVCSDLIEGCQCVSHFDKTESWEFVYWTSIVILSVLVFNVLLLMVAFGAAFFRHPGYILDAFVVGTALALEIFLDKDTVGLLIILSLWRIVRVAHGIFEVTDEAWEKEIRHFEKTLQDAESHHDSDQKLLDEKDKRIAELEKAKGGKRHH